ncbi:MULTISPECIES: hypothetical protein [unclassified Pseudomonas]|uniref:hypothetical protein n=1 Tax=unclassified Pseudomonas TaxID=196821 RepID=UPI00131AD17C|nr:MULTISPECIES: hypothetical protein [unclassified Pseudomonas]
MSIHIHSPSGIYYAQVRRRFERRWTQVGGKFLSREKAQACIGSNMTGDFYFGRVLFCADYYDPILVMEAKR